MIEFFVKRTSAWDEKPCDEAYEKPYLSTDQRGVSDPKYLGNMAASWYEKGANHRLTDGKYITRDMPQEAGWFVKFEGLDDLLAFITKYGDVVIEHKSSRAKDCFTIEIYDDYRE